VSDEKPTTKVAETAAETAMKLDECYKDGLKRGENTVRYVYTKRKTCYVTGVRILKKSCPRVSLSFGCDVTVPA